MRQLVCCACLPRKVVAAIVDFFAEHAICIITARNVIIDPTSDAVSQASIWQMQKEPRGAECAVLLFPNLMLLKQKESDCCPFYSYPTSQVQLMIAEERGPCCFHA